MHTTPPPRVTSTPLLHLHLSTAIAMALKPSKTHLTWALTTICTHMEKTEDQINGEEKQEHALPPMALNHVSRLCRSVKESIDFYVKVLGFVLIQRPQVLHFDGAWLFNYGVGIHLVQAKEEDYCRLPDRDHLDPMDNHISFQVLLISFSPACCKLSV